MRRLLFLLLFVAAFTGAYLITDRNRPRDAYHTVCELVSRHFFKDSPELRSWITRCREAARALPSRTSAEDVLRLLQERMDELNVSHFSVFAPAEDRKLWTGQAVHTGIRSRYVDGHLLVYDVIAGSAAARADVRAGDEITRLPGVDEVSPAGAARRAGEYVLLRRGRELRVAIDPRPVVIDGAPRVRDLDHGLVVFTIPSFRAEYFGTAALDGLTRRLSAAKGIVVDVRENSGGNFTAMLRALSFFTCGSGTIGHLRQARNLGGEVGTLVNSLNDQRQIRQLERSRELALTTPVGYGCFGGPVVTLIGPATASVAEIFADAIKSRPRSRVWGWPSAGDVVMAIWYPLPSLGRDFSVSIPQASYVNARGIDLEGRGVRPTRELFYDLERARAGEDTWVSEAARALR